jgi:hypothetical protein
MKHVGPLERGGNRPHNSGPRPPRLALPKRPPQPRLARLRIGAYTGQLASNIADGKDGRNAHLTGRSALISSFQKASCARQDLQLKCN